MSYALEYEPEALADLEKLTGVVRQRIIDKINWLVTNFEQITPEPLTGNWSGFYKLRVGDYRVVYEFSAEAKLITIDRIGHRREVYE
jgi:mRNA interferase RelE/StbE